MALMALSALSSNVTLRCDNFGNAQLFLVKFGALSTQIVENYYILNHNVARDFANVPFESML